MSYINNMNPRRMIWFNQNAPKNKMDLWLSYNRHYEDTSEDETVDPQLVDDNPSQRKCDLILKAWDCGKWVPIVGFNTTAANKIDTVEGNTLYHPAIFTGENPNDLYDAGSLGSLLSNPNFVNEQEWYDVFNSTDYSWDNIFGDTNWFGDLIWETIQGGSSTYHLPWATTTQCGGILSATHPAVSSAFKPIEVKFYPTVLGYYQNEQHRLCVSASEVIQLINNYYNDNPSGSTVNIQLANTERIGGIKAAQDPLDADDCRNIPIVLAGPTVGSVWGLPFGSGTYPGDTDNETEYLYLPGWALLEWMKNPYFNQQEPQPFITGWKGVDTLLRENSDLIWVGLSGVTPENTGKFCTIQLNNTDPSGATIDWVDLVLNHLTDVNIQNPANNQILIYNSTTGKWENGNSLLQVIDFATDRQCGGIYADQFNYLPNYWAEAKFAPTGSSAWSPYEHRLIVDLESVTYKDGNLISINQNNQINIDASNSQNGNVIISDSGVAKWGAVPNPTLGSTLISSGGFVTINGLRISTTTSFDINGQPYLGLDYDLNTWNYYTLENAKSIAITNTQTNPEPLYIRVISAPATQAFSCAGDIIDAQNVLSDTYEKDILITMLFGIARFEEINTQSSTPAINELN